VVDQNRDTSSMDVLAARGRRVRLVWDSQHNRPVDRGDASLGPREVGT
jgi:hypothetical protein